MKRIGKMTVIMIILGSALAALMIFARPPEEINITAADGRVSISGEVPKNSAAPSINKISLEKDKPSLPFLFPIYEIKPLDALLPVPLQLSFSYTKEDLAGNNPGDFTTARFNDKYNRWETVSSGIDLVNQKIISNIRTLGRWTIVFNKENPSVSKEVDGLILNFLSDQPQNFLAYNVDLEYSRNGDDFLLFYPAYKRDGCGGFITGNEEKIVQNAVAVNDVTYRLSLTWQIGDQSRCGRDKIF